MKKTYEIILPAEGGSCRAEGAYPGHPVNCVSALTCYSCCFINHHYPSYISVFIGGWQFVD